MNITFIIGNGFDMNIGLQTSYSAFLKEYKQGKQNDTELIKWFKKEVLSDEELWASAEVAFGRTTEQFSNKKYTAENFYECYEDFCINLAEYLKNQEKRIDDEIIKELATSSFLKAITNWLGGFREAEKETINSIVNKIGGGFQYNFISFNYTLTLDRCVNPIKNAKGILGTRTFGNTSYGNNIGNIYHVHGYTDKDMVFGVNDESQISDLSIFDGFDGEYLNQLIKIKTNKMNNQNMDAKVHNLLKNSDLIYIYGMSIGETDKLWWGRICEIMKERKNLQLLIYNYEAPTEELFQLKFRLFVNKERDKFLSFSNLNDADKKLLSERIHFARNNLFKGISDSVSEKSSNK